MLNQTLKGALTLTAAFSLNASAVTFVDALIPEGAKSYVDMPCGGAECERDCTDFSGEWVGACALDASSATVPHTLKVEQNGCNHITVNKDRLPIGGMKTETLTIAANADGAAKAFTSLTEFHVDWSADKKKLEFLKREGARNLGSPMTRGDITGEFQLVNRHLLLDLNGQNAAGEDFRVSCSFEK